MVPVRGADQLEMGPAQSVVNCTGSAPGAVSDAIESQTTELQGCGNRILQQCGCGMGSSKSCSQLNSGWGLHAT